MKLVDSTVAIDHFRGRAEANDLIDRLARSGELATSELVRYELLAGMHERERPDLDRFFGVIEWWAVDEGVARLGGLLAQKFRSSHSGIDDVDYLVAATALVHDADLLTTNIRHFPMLEGLRAPY